MAQNNKVQHRGRIRQIPLYFIKFLRMFIYMDDWKVIPMSAIVAGAVCLVAGKRMFHSMEGTLMGALALTCICIWNGFFNSIQSVCRERDIIKREHRNGMHVFSYIMAHMLYQALICITQVIVTITVCRYGGMTFPEKGIVTPYFYVDLAISLFLITYAADMLSLLISSIARNTTSAMTIMPFMLIFELLFSGSIFSLGEKLEPLANLSFAKWGVSLLSSLSNYNDQPMNAVWKQILKFQDVEIYGETPIKTVVEFILDNDLKEKFCLLVGQNSQVTDYASTASNVANDWIVLIMFSLVFALFAIIVLERIDKDKR